MDRPTLAGVLDLEIRTLPVLSGPEFRILERHLGQIATVTRIDTTGYDSTKTVVKVVNNLNNSISYIVYTEEGQKEFMIQLTPGRTLADIGVSVEASLSDSAVLAGIQAAFQAGGIQVVDSPASSGILNIEFYELTKLDSGFMRITSEIWHQGFGPSHVRTSSNGVIINDGRTHWRILG